MIEIFSLGINNILEADKIKPGASSDSLGWKTKDTSIELSRGSIIEGDESIESGSIQGSGIFKRNDGTIVKFRKISNSIQYLNSSDVWTDVVTGLTDGAWYRFNEYVTNSGSFVFVTGIDGCFKIPTSNPESAITLTDINKSPTGTTDYGLSLISSSRMFTWDLIKNRVALFLSYIDSQNFTDVSTEAIGSSGSTNYTGTLVFKAGGSTRSCHNIVFTDGTLNLVDDNNGGFTGDGEGTINYATGEYNITFNATTTGAVTSDYSWEDSNNGGITDFTFTSPTRGAGEGDVMPQELGGSRIRNVIPIDGKYYSIKDNSVYELDLTIDDTNATNLVYNAAIGSLYHGSSIATRLGIVFMDTSNPELPKLTRLQYNITGDRLYPKELATHFDFSNFEWDKCIIKTYGEDIVLTTKTISSTYNNRIIRYNSRLKSVDVYSYRADTLDSKEGILYAGDSLSENTYRIFNGFDDNGNVVENYWKSDANRFKTDKLKRYKWQKLKGFISKDQSYEVYASYDNGAFQLIGTVKGNESYVDKAQSINIGSNEIGSKEIGGGGEGITAYYYEYEFKARTPKFEKRILMFKAIGIGFTSISFIDEKEIQLSGSSRRVPKKYRVTN